MQIQQYSTVNAAIREQKKFYEYYCVITGGQMTTDGAHIFPRDTYPHLKKANVNILPMNRDAHRAFDRMKPEKKIAWLAENVHWEFVERVREQLKALLTLQSTEFLENYVNEMSE